MRTSPPKTKPTQTVTPGANGIPMAMQMARGIGAASNSNSEPAGGSIGNVTMVGAGPFRIQLLGNVGNATQHIAMMLPSFADSHNAAPHGFGTMWSRG